MQQNEVNMIVQCIPYVDRKQREADRTNKYLKIQQNTKKHIDIQKWFPFPWDSEGKNTGTIMTEEEKKEAMKRAKEIEERMTHMTFRESVNMEDMYKNTHMKQHG